MLYYLVVYQYTCKTPLTLLYQLYRATRDFHHLLFIPASGARVADFSRNSNFYEKKNIYSDKKLKIYITQNINLYICEIFFIKKITTSLYRMRYKTLSLKNIFQFFFWKKIFCFSEMKINFVVLH